MFPVKHLRAVTAQLLRERAGGARRDDGPSSSRPVWSGCANVWTGSAGPAELGDGAARLSAGEPAGAPPAPGHTAASRDTLLKRARAHFLSVPIAVALAELRGDLEQSYRNTVYCAAQLEHRAGKVTTRYCGQRWCLVCARVRTARAVNRYLPVVQGWRDPHLVTVTRPNVPGADLGAELRALLATFTACKRAIKRTDRLPFKALRKIECTYNPERDDYHPHFHLIVEGPEAAHAFVARWLAENPTAVAKAQDVRPADAGALRELFKYFTKLTVKVRGANGTTSRGLPQAESLDTIFRAMRGLRVYQPVGFTVASDAPDENAKIDDGPGTPAPVAAPDGTRWEWQQGAADWVDETTGECLSGYEPSARFRRFADSIGAHALTAYALARLNAYRQATTVRARLERARALDELRVCAEIQDDAAAVHFATRRDPPDVDDAAAEIPPAPVDVQLVLGGRLIAAASTRRARCAIATG